MESEPSAFIFSFIRRTLFRVDSNRATAKEHTSSGSKCDMHRLNSGYIVHTYCSEYIGSEYIGSEYTDSEYIGSEHRFRVHR